MGQKINYNKKNSSKWKIVATIILCLLAIFIVIKSLRDAVRSLKEEQSNLSQTSNIQYSVSSYDSLSSLLASRNCKLINQSAANGGIIATVNFPVDLYSGDVSNENYFLSICKLVAEFINYKNFELKDNNKNIDIEVFCEKPNIVEFKINGDINYYLNHDSERFAKNRENTVSNFIIQSPELQSAINSGWDENGVNWGTKEATCEGYQIYFDEGIKYKVVSRSIFNIIFTKKYQGEIAGGLNANSSRDQVESALGTPTFSDGDNIYGYVSERNYLFFDFLNKEVSVYPVVKVGRLDEEELKNDITELNNTNDAKKFATSLTGMWIDYDVYDYDSNYVDLRYTLRGVKLDISSASLKNGIFIYQNYSGNIDIADLENVYLTNTDMVFEEEKERSMDEYLKRHIEGELSEEEKKSFGISFGLRFLDADEDGYRGPIFYSRTGEFSDSELDKNLQLSSYKWYDDSKLVYSVNYDGIYVYNCETRVNAKVIDLDKEIIITSAGDGQIIYNNNEVVNVEIN